MSDALTPLRHAYGVEPPGAPLAPGEPGYPEQEAARQLRAVLDAHPIHRPDPSVVGAVIARAAEIRSRAEASITDLTLAPLASALGLGSTADAPDAAETALLAQTAEALDRLPTYRPDEATVEAICAAAAQATDAALTAIRHVYEGADAPETVERDLLHQSREIVERAFASRPQPRPRDAVVAPILARAAEASGTTDEPVTDPALAPLAAALGLGSTADAPDAAETALLAQTAEALDRLPANRPRTDVVEAVLAHAASAAAPSRPARRPAADRSAARGSRSQTPVGVWASGVGLMLAALAAVFVVPAAFESDALPEVATVAEAEGVSSVEESAPLVAADVQDEPDPTPPPAASPALAGAAAVSAFVPVTETVRRPAASTPEPVASASAPRSTPPPAWDNDEDMRTLALRLDELDRETEGLAWDEPAEEFGRPTSGASSTSRPGIQAVRAGAAPARVVVRPDSSQSPR